MKAHRYAKGRGTWGSGGTCGAPVQMVQWTFLMTISCVFSCWCVEVLKEVDGIYIPFLIDYGAQASITVLEIIESLLISN